MSPTRRDPPTWRAVLEQHATWQHWTAAIDVQWRPDGVILTGVPARWGAETTAPDFAIQGATMPPPRIRLWRLVRYALRRYHVTIVPQRDETILHLRIKER